MKKILFFNLYFLFLTSNPTSAQLLRGMFAFGGTSADQGKAMVQTTDGGYAITGITQSYASGSYSVYILKLDSLGNLAWTKSIGGANDDEGYSIIQTTDGGYAITGITTSYGYASGSENVYVIKLNAAGDTMWTRVIGGTIGDWGLCIIQTTDGGYAISGLTYSFGDGSGDVYVIKLDSSGNLIWTKSIGGSGYDDGKCIIQTNDGGYAITGVTYSYGEGFNDAYIIKLDSAGNLKWTKTVGGPADDYGISIIQINDGSYVIAGYTNSYGAGESDAYMFKLDTAGNLIWTKTLGASGFDYATSIVQTKDGGYAVAGITDSYGSTGLTDEVYVLKLDSAANPLYVRVIGDGSAYKNSDAYSIIQTKDGGFAVAGQTEVYGVGTESVFVIKFDSTLISCSLKNEAIMVDSGGLETNGGGFVSTGGAVSHGGVINSGGQTTVVCSVVAVPPPVADFQASDTIFCSGKCINFTNLSTNATQYQWIFSGASDSTSADKSPLNICYPTAGIYKVTLIATNPGGNDTLTLSNYIKVNASPPAPVITQRHDTLFCSTNPAYTSYQWFLDSNMINGAIDTLLVISSGGQYNVKVSSENGCDVATGFTVGINEYAQNNYISLFPNPAANQLIVISYKLYGSSELIIYNVLGEACYQSIITNPKSEIDVSPFPAGIYFVQITNDNDRWVGKFVKE